MFLIIGTTIGACYASGRELWQFFGHESGLAILLFVIFFTMSCIIIMKISYDKKSTDYLPVLDHIMGGKLGRIYDVMIFFYLFSTRIFIHIGIRGCGHAF